jgi:hypothetical protein
MSKAMPKTSKSHNDRFKLIAAFLTVGIISLIQPGCSCSSSNNGTSQPSAVTSVSPLSDSASSLVTTNVSAIFNNDMDGDTVITAFTLTLNNSPVPAIVNYDSVTKTALLTPQADLASDAEYRATIDSSVKDVNGDSPLSSNYVWSFKISSAMQLVSKNSSGVSSNDISRNSDIDATGQFIVFESEATNLASVATTLNRQHIYRKDTISGEVLLVSSDASGLVEANNQASNPSISSNGRYVVFNSKATNLDAAINSNGISQVYLKDMDDGSIDLVSRNAFLVPANNGLDDVKNAKVSDDGTLIVFESGDSNLSAIISGGVTQIYLKNMKDESVTMISRTTADTAGNNASNNPDMSADGTHIVFESLATNFTASNSIKHIYYVDANATTHTVEQISLSSAGTEATADSNLPSVSDDGLMVVYHTGTDTILDAADANGAIDVYLRYRPLLFTKLVSANPNTGNSGNNDSSNASINGDANYVVFESLASDLVTGDISGAKDIFVRDLSDLPEKKIDRINNPVGGEEPSSDSDKPVISHDGRYASFHSIVPYTLDDTDTLIDVFRAYNSTIP